MPNEELYGFLYPKKDRQGNQPNLTGSILIEGKTWELAAWTKTAKSSGVKYLSLKAQEAGGAAEAPPEGSDQGTQEDIPF